MDGTYCGAGGRAILCLLVTKLAWVVVVGSCAAPVLVLRTTSFLWTGYMAAKDMREGEKSVYWKPIFRCCDLIL
ncbi:hypothetical protein F5Y03DRAFT_352244 [Xylaria venustula]|nr:hypothetical protein F5Y03DRAFT_352244 [Xylaria venustula]